MPKKNVSYIGKFARFTATVALLLGELFLSLVACYIAATVIKAFGEAMEGLYK